jgi:uncharacterized membrane protein
MQLNNLSKAVLAGVVATVVMTMVMVMAPFMGMPEMNIGKMLGEFMGVPAIVGWVAHFMIGSVLAIIFATAFAASLPGAPWLKGVLFGLIPWLGAQVMVNPMMGAGVFASNMPAPLMMVMGSLLGHMVYGAVLGAVYGRSIAKTVFAIPQH